VIFFLLILIYFKNFVKKGEEAREKEMREEMREEMRRGEKRGEKRSWKKEERTIFFLQVFIFRQFRFADRDLGDSRKCRSFAKCELADWRPSPESEVCDFLPEREYRGHGM